MPRQRLTSEDLDSVRTLQAAREHVRLAESILGPAATDREVLDTANRLSSLSPEQVRTINKNRSAIASQTKRVATFDGSEDPWAEAGPDQPDPTNNQAYTKQIMTPTDHGVQDSLQKRDVHTPTASRATKLSRQSRRKWGASEETEVPRPSTRESEYDDHPEDLDEGFEDESGEMDDLDEGGEFDEHGMDDRHDMDDSHEFSDMDDDHGLDHDDEFTDMADHGHDDFDDEADFDQEEPDFDDMGEEGGEFGLDSDEDDLDNLMGMDEEDAGLHGDEGLGDEGGPDIFDTVDDDLDHGGDMGHDPEMDDDGHMMDHEHHRSSTPPMAPMASRNKRTQAGRKGRQASQKSQPGTRRRVSASGGGGSRISLDDILNLHEEDIERTAAQPLEGDDLEALLGSKGRASNRVATQGHAGYRSAALESRLADATVWNTENEPELQRGKRQASGQRRTAGKNPRKPPQGRIIQPFVPDRRRVSQKPRGNEFDQVFGVPDVSKYFD